MLRKYTWIFFLPALFFSQLAIGQIQIGIKGGAMLTDFNNFGKNRIFKIEEEQILDLYAGPSVGIVFKKELKNNWFLQGETRLAYQVGIGDLANQPDFFFLTIPIVVDRRIYKFIHAQVGFGVNVLLEQSNENGIDLIDETVDVLLLGGFEFDLSSNFQVGIRAGLGFRPLAKIIYTNADGEFDRESILRENQLSLHGTYFF
jgi:hypothetical protein